MRYLILKLTLSPLCLYAVKWNEISPNISKYLGWSLEKVCSHSYTPMFIILFQPGRGSKDRVEAFIDGTSGYVQVSPPDTPPMDDSQSDSSISPVSRRAESPKYNFVIHPEIKSAFVAQFNLLKKRIMQRGFNVIWIIIIVNCYLLIFSNNKLKYHSQ